MPVSAAGWRIEPPVSVPIDERRVERRDRDGRPAAAAAGHRVEVPRVRDGAVGAVLVRRAHRELVHVRLAEDHRAGVTQPLGDVGVVRGDVALEDLRAGGALAALDGDEVLERDRDAEQRRERRRGRPPSPLAAAIRASAASASASAPSRSIASQALSARLSRSAAARWASASSRALISPARSRAAISWAWSRVRFVIGRRRARSVAAEDRRDDDEVALALGGVAQDGLDRQRVADDVVAEDVLELDRLGGRRDCSVSSPARIVYWSRMWFSWPSSSASSSSVRPRRAR